jgi:hypothetical protein
MAAENLKPKGTKKAKAALVAYPAMKMAHCPSVKSVKRRHLPCGFCGLHYFDENSVLKGQWNRSQDRKKFFS